MLLAHPRRQDFQEMKDLVMGSLLLSPPLPFCLFLSHRFSSHGVSTFSMTMPSEWISIPELSPRGPGCYICQLDISTRMSHWHLKFSMSKTKCLIPCCTHCQLALFLPLCPQSRNGIIIHLVAYTRNPESFLISPFPSSPYPIHQQVLSGFLSNICLILVPFSSHSLSSCSSSCFYLLPGLGQKLWTCLPALPLAPSSSS